MGLFDLIDGIKKRNERKETIKKCLKEAKNYIYDGKLLYKESRIIAENYAKEINDMIVRHSAYKREVLQDFDQNIQPIMKKFTAFHIENRTVNISLEKYSSGDRLSKSTEFCLMPQSGIGILDIIEFFSTDDDYYKAIEQRDQAKYFYHDMKHQEQRLRAIRKKLNAIQQHIEEKQNMITSLFDKTKSIAQELRKNMRKEQFSEKEASYLSGIHQIAKKLAVLLSAQFLNDDLEITKEYRENYNLMKSIHQELQEAPMVNSGKDWLSWMRQLDKYVKN